jgi:alpha-beta hydrolase superfamily lysophospholipase
MSAYLPDELPGFEMRTLSLPQEGDGELAATLVRRVSERKTSGPAILFLHGFSDYFFQSFLADAFLSAGFSFYALDLRRHGRSLRPGNLPNFMKSIDDWFVELTWALETIESEQGGPVLIVSHSTGSILSTLYAKRGGRRDLVHGLMLDSPFFEFAASPRALAALPWLARLGQALPKLRLPLALGTTYGDTLHASRNGEWNYNLEWKPLAGFPVRAGWLRAVHLGQKEIQAGLGLALPVLVMFSERSFPPGGRLVPEAHLADAVLNVADMIKFGPGLGPHVELLGIDGGKHDLFLSRKDVRDQAIQAAVRFAQGVVDGA